MSFPWVRAVNGRIFKNSFVEKSSNTILTDIANCAVSTASIDSSSCIEKIHSTDTIISSVSGRGSRVVEVSDRGLPCPEFEPSTTKDPPYRVAMHVRELKRPPVGVVW
ncbi:hypothetical protein TNCV_238861 [Trichonephila clavipes]|nr:hypothetical protein TNCV_238861 [Trichonephila clavipes]